MNWKIYDRHRFELQLTRADAARKAGVTQEAARLRDGQIKRGEVNPYKTGRTHPTRAAREAEIKGETGINAPINHDNLIPQAKRALDDFEYFRLRYFGRRSMPWAVDAMHRLDVMVRDPERTYTVINVAPGVGKTTLLHDFAVWETTKQRWLRGLWGSATQQLAALSTKRLRSTLGASYKVRAKIKDREAGYAADAEATLVGDFGRFKPLNAGVWRVDQFVIEQFEEENYDEKEPTWGAFGENSEEIGWRANLIIWDDLVTKDTVNATLEAMDRQREWFDDVAEERLEPGGLFALMGQRLAANDLYRYCLDKLIGDEVNFEGEDTYEQPKNAMYHHIVYPAHDPNICKGHDNDSKVPQKPWTPDGNGGCLLDPYRISWHKCKQTMADPQKWETVYQQGDTSAQDVLVQKLWVDGGLDNRTREMFVGCYDENRAATEIPLNEEGEPNRTLVSYMTVDPSPTRYWGALWMAYDPISKKRYVLDVWRGRMQAGDFLDFINGQSVGLAHQWITRSHDIGLPITTMVVEANSAERFLLQYEHVRNWMQRMGVRILAHQTFANKADPKFGVQTIGGIWRQGLVRLPGGSRHITKPLVQEVTTYPHGASDDLVMSFWFGEYNLRTICSGSQTESFKRIVPSWLKRREAVFA